MSTPPDKPPTLKTSKKVKPLGERSMDVSRLLDQALVDAAEDEEEFPEEPASSITQVLDTVVQEFEEEAPGQPRRKP